MADNLFNAYGVSHKMLIEQIIFYIDAYRVSDYILNI